MVKSLTDTIRNDKQYLRAKRSLENIKSSLNTKELMDELFSLQVSRGVTALKPNKILRSSLAVMLDASTQEIAVRSRATTIKMTALRALLSLEQLLDPLRKYLLSTYGSTMKDSGSKTLASQRASIDNYLKLFIRETRQIDYLIKIADLVIEDTDSAGWSLKRISETLEQNAKDR